MEKMLHQKGAAALDWLAPTSVLGVFHSSARQSHGWLDPVVATVLLQVGGWTRDLQMSLLANTTVNTHRVPPQLHHTGCAFPGLPPATGRKYFPPFFLAQL